jgi:hypothetical protein
MYPLSIQLIKGEKLSVKQLFWTDSATADEIYVRMLFQSVENFIIQKKFFKWVEEVC